MSFSYGNIGHFVYVYCFVYILRPLFVLLMSYSYGSRIDFTIASAPFANFKPQTSTQKGL